MGSRSKFHGLTGIKSRQPKSNVNDRARKAKLKEKKQPLLDEISGALKGVSEVS